MQRKQNISYEISQDGFAGPYPRFAEIETLDKIYERIVELSTRQETHPLYGRFSVRDWHLIERDILKLLSNTEIVRRVASVLGDDILLWRSKIFLKRPGDGPLGWHQEWGAFNGEEIGNDRPSLVPREKEEPWNITVWVALCDIDQSMGPIRFARGSNHRRYPIDMVPMQSSEFFHDPFLETREPSEIMRRARENSLILDIDTSSVFNDSDLNSPEFGIEAVKKRLGDFLNQQRGAKTLDFDESRVEVISLPMKQGEFVLFSERTMHGSSENKSQKPRLAINARYTMSSTLVYPQRLQGDYIDGSNIDIRRHRCCLVSGANLNTFNVVG